MFLFSLPFGRKRSEDYNINHHESCSAKKGYCILWSYILVKHIFFLVTRQKKREENSLTVIQKFRFNPLEI